MRYLYKVCLKNKTILEKLPCSFGTKNDLIFGVSIYIVHCITPGTISLIFYPFWHFRTLTTYHDRVFQKICVSTLNEKKSPLLGNSNIKDTWFIKLQSSTQTEL